MSYLRYLLAAIAILEGVNPWNKLTCYCYHVLIQEIILFSATQSTPTYLPFRQPRVPPRPRTSHKLEALQATTTPRDLPPHTPP